VDFLLVLYGEREPEAYTRLMDTFGQTAMDDDGDVRARLHRYIDESRQQHGANSVLDATTLASAVAAFLKELGDEIIRSLSAEYERGDYLKKKIEETLERINVLWETSSGLISALARFSEDLAVRIMTIHKSKGLEFHSVILLGIEEEAFFG